MRAAALLLLIAACTSPNPTGPTPPYELDFADWNSWPRSNPERMWSRAHGKQHVDIHVAPDTFDAYRRGDNPMPVGSRIIKAIYADANAGAPLRLTAMIKRGPGYDADDHDWMYAVLDGDGVTVKASGRLDLCIDCHILNADDDYLYRPRGGGSWRDAYPAKPGQTPQ